MTDTHPDFIKAWTKAVDKGLIKGDPAYYYNSEASQQEVNHALITALLEVNGTPWDTVEPEPEPPPTTPPTTGTYAHTVEIAPGVRSITVESDTRYVMPEGRMEGAGAQYAFRSNGYVEHVMIDGVEMTGYDPPQQAGVIQLAPNGNTLSGKDVIIDGVHIHDCDEVAIKTRVDDVVIRNFRIEDMGRLGLSVGHGADSTAKGGLIEDGTIVRCNADGKNSWGFEAGGSKFWQSTNLTVRRVESYGHVGPGLWADKDNVGWIVEDCDIHDCAGAPGIFQEIGGAYTIRRNSVINCGDKPAAWLWDAGIQVSSSDNGKIYDNYIENCGHGISLVQQNRGSGAFGTHLLLDNEVYNNVIRSSVASGVARADLEYPTIWERNKSWHGNSYDAGHQFAWKNSWGNLAFWQQEHPEDGV